MVAPSLACMQGAASARIRSHAQGRSRRHGAMRPWRKRQAPPQDLVERPSCRIPAVRMRVRRSFRLLLRRHRMSVGSSCRFDPQEEGSSGRSRRSPSQRVRQPGRRPANTRGPVGFATPACAGCACLSNRTASGQPTCRTANSCCHGSLMQCPERVRSGRVAAARGDRWRHRCHTPMPV